MTFVGRRMDMLINLAVTSGSGEEAFSRDQYLCIAAAQLHLTQ